MMRMLPVKLPCPVAASTNSDTVNPPRSAAPMNRKTRNPRKHRERETNANDPSNFETDLSAE
jgi:hypothetical protein